MAGSLQERIYHLLCEEYHTDISFLVQGQEFKCHKIVIGAAGGSLKKMVDIGKDRVDIGDEIAPYTFKNILKYVYTDQCKINDFNLFEVFYAAIYFGLCDLEDRCVQICREKFTDENIGYFTQQALLFGSEDLQTLCLKYFGANTASILNNNSFFLQISHETLFHLCGTEKLNCTELRLFQACVKWANEECDRKEWPKTGRQLRTVLGNVLNKIRFTTMTKQQFLAKVVPLNILTDANVGKVVKSWTTVNQGHPKPEKCRNGPIMVTFLNFMGNTCLSIPYSSQIADVKRMPIWESGSKIHSGEYFTISYNDKELTDDVQLSSLALETETLCLRLYSTTYSIREGQGKWSFLFKISETKKAAWCHLVKSRVYAKYSIPPGRLAVGSIPSYPGNTIPVNIRN